MLASQMLVGTLVHSLANEGTKESNMFYMRTLSFTFWLENCNQKIILLNENAILHHFYLYYNLQKIYSGFKIVVSKW